MISDLVSLEFAYASKSFEENFQTLSSLVQKTPKNSLVQAPELCLSGYRYEKLELSAKFSQQIVPKIKELSKDRILSLTLVEKVGENFFNIAKIYHDEKEIYSRAKVKLFSLGEEEKHFAQGDTKEIKTVDIEGTKIALLVCFELRFTKLWDRVSGADIVLIPSYWGKGRKEHLAILSRALAVANQCFVIVSNSSDDDMASNSCIITPFGEVIEDSSFGLIKAKFSKKLVTKMRRYIDVGLV